MPTSNTPTMQDLLAEMIRTRQELELLRADRAGGSRPRGVVALLRGRRPSLRLFASAAVVLCVLNSSSGVTRAARAAAFPPLFWSLTGTSGTNPSADFLGTHDAQPLVLRTNNAEAMRIAANGNVGIGTTIPTVKLTINGSVSATGGTFTNPINGSITGNAGTVSNGVYTSGSYNDPAWISSLAGNKIIGKVASAASADSAITVSNGVYTTGSYADPAWITALAGSKIAGAVANATHATGADSAATATTFMGSLSGDVTGGQSSTAVTALRGVPLSSTAPSAGQVLTYNGTSWVAATGTTGVPTSPPDLCPGCYMPGATGRRQPGRRQPGRSLFWPRSGEQWCRPDRRNPDRRKPQRR